jgi:phosphoribosylanthranilate isomerase
VPVIVQIYSARSVTDAVNLVELGVDHIGFVAGVYGVVKSELPFGDARAIADALRGKAKSSAITMSTDTAEILHMAEAVRPDIIHISTDTKVVGVAAMRRLRAALPAGIALMKAIHIEGPESLDLALTFAPVSDMLLLDTKVVGFPGVGATGTAHDWRISQQIIEQVGDQARVILAGGLTPENVAAAIHATQPWGVDSFTGTNRLGSREKDLTLVKRFVEQAKQA